MYQWLDSRTLAGLAALSARKARAALSRAYVDRATWRGADLVVRSVSGRGGRSGLCYEVRLDSLPADIQEAFRASQSPRERRLSDGEKAQREREFWYHLIAPLLPLAKHSRERGAALAEVAKRKHFGPNGKPVTVTVRNLQRKIEAFEGFGMAGLSREARADRGERRTILSRSWDKAVSLDDATRERIAEDLRQYVRGLIKRGEVPSVVRLLAQDHLARMTKDAGWIGPEASLLDACRIPANLLEAEKHFAKVFRFDRDRKAHEDAKPRIRRTAVGLRPMEIVVGDVHPIDVVLQRDDGSRAHARAIAWLDFATNRLWVDAVLYAPGKSVTNADVIRSFIRMADAWGAPEHLYLDNGSEYNWAEFIDDALQLIQLGNAGSLVEVSPWDRRTSNIVRARAYNASAKPIENIFKQLERLLQPVPGWIGGDRMKSKSANVGRAPDPFPGSFDDFNHTLAATLALYHHKPQTRRGFAAKVSPLQALTAAVTEGWQPTLIDARALRVAFSEKKECRVIRGVIQNSGRMWTCDELLAFQGTKVTVLEPKWDDWSCRPVLVDGQVWFALPEKEYRPFDPEGAKEAGRRSNISKAAVRALDRSTPDVDPLAERIALLDRQPVLPSPQGAGLVTYSKTASKIADHILKPADELSAEQSDRQSQHTRRLIEEETAFLRSAGGR